MFFDVWGLKSFSPMGRCTYEWPHIYKYMLLDLKKNQQYMKEKLNKMRNNNLHHFISLGERSLTRLESVVFLVSLQSPALSGYEHLNGMTEILVLK